MKSTCALYKTFGRKDKRHRLAGWGRQLLSLAGILTILGGLPAPSLMAQQAAASDHGQAPSSVDEQLREMREEIQALRLEVSGLRQELHQGAHVVNESSAPATQLAVVSTTRRELASANPAPLLADRVSPGPGASMWQMDAAGITRSKLAWPASITPVPAAGQNYPAPSQPAAPEPQPNDQQSTDLAGRVTMLQSQVAEQAQTKVESYSKMGVKLFGTILSTTFFNSGPADWADVPSVVNWAKAVPSSTGSFGSSMRQSRVGLMVDGPQIGSMRASGYIAVDFLGGAADFQSGPLFGLPHVVYGYVRVDGTKTAIEAGQDELILSSRHPTSLVAMAFPELFRSGDLYDRAPQVRVERELAGNKHGSLRATVGLVSPVANYPGLDFPGADLLESWQRPAIQGRLAWREAEAPSIYNSGFEFGVSGHYGRVQLGNSLGISAVPAFSAASWAGAIDFNAHVRHFGLDGSGYIGQNLESFGGGIGQPGKTFGGFVEARYSPTYRLQFNSGFGTDHLTKFDIIPVDLNRNTSVFANTIFQFTPEVAASFEYRHLVTRPFTGVLRTNNHVDVGIAYSF